MQKQKGSTLKNISTYGLGATLSTALITSNAFALDPADVATATSGSNAGDTVDAGALWILGIVVTIFAAKKVIGFFSR